MYMYNNICMNDKVSMYSVVLYVSSDVLLQVDIKFLCAGYNTLQHENIHGIQFNNLAQIGQIQGIKY